MSCSTPYLEAFAHLQLPSGAVWPCIDGGDQREWKKSLLEKLTHFNLALHLNNLLQRYTDSKCVYTENVGFTFRGNHHTYRLFYNDDEWHVYAEYDGEFQEIGLGTEELDGLMRAIMKMIWQSVYRKEQTIEELRLPKNEVTVKNGRLIWQQGLTIWELTGGLYRINDSPQIIPSLNKALVLVMDEITAQEIESSYEL